MFKALKRTNAERLPEAGRRSFLRGSLAATAVALAPTVGEAATPADEGSDWKLFDLLDEAKVLVERQNAAIDAEEAACDRIDRPEVPDILLRRDGEELLLLPTDPSGQALLSA